jgi:hypothetical protein
LKRLFQQPARGTTIEDTCDDQLAVANAVLERSRFLIAQLMKGEFYLDRLTLIAPEEVVGVAVLRRRVKFLDRFQYRRLARAVAADERRMRAEADFDISKRSKVLDARALELHCPPPVCLLFDLDRFECKGNHIHPDRHPEGGASDVRASAAAHPGLNERQLSGSV